MKLSELELPQDRKDHIKEVCTCFNASALRVVDFTFVEIGRKNNGLLDSKNQGRVNQVA